MITASRLAVGGLAGIALGPMLAAATGAGVGVRLAALGVGVLLIGLAIVTALCDAADIELVSEDVSARGTTPLVLVEPAAVERSTDHPGTPAFRA